ncbi:MAG: hypothetical protein Q9226_008709 [Calogaya cf. arnoldii]
MKIVSRESSVCLTRLRNNGTCSVLHEQDINTSPLFRFTLNVSLAITYGLSSDDDIDSDLLLDILRKEKTSLASRRGLIAQPLPGFRGKGDNVYQPTRHEHISLLLENLRAKIAQRTDKPCIMGGVLKNAVDVFTEEELTSISLTMISAYIDALFRNLALGLGYLSSSAGQTLQCEAHRQIMHAYRDGDAWEKCVTEERIPFITALSKKHFDTGLLFRSARLALA